MRLAALVVAATVVVTVVVGSRAPARADGAEPLATPAPATTEPAQEKSPMLALGLSAGATAAGIALAAEGDHRNNHAMTIVGLAILDSGPSLGHWYAGERVSDGLVVRGIGTVMFGGGAALAGASCKDDGCEIWGAFLAVSGGVLILVGGANDLWTAPRAASDWNRAHQLGAYPIAMPAIDGAAPGFAIGGRF